MPNTINKKSYKLSIYLLKDDVTSFRKALKPRVDITEYKIKKQLGVKGIICIGKTKSNKSGWKELLQDGTDSTLPELESSSNRAVLLLEIQGRIYALPFGYGKHLINEELIEREFGLKTALNIINADGLRSVDKANLDDLTVLTRTQTSRRAKPQAFSLDIIRDLLRGVTGEPSVGNENFGSIITGNEGVYIIPAIEFADIVPRLKELNKAYSSNKYKARFDWIDNLKTERDPVIINILRDKLVADVKAENDILIHISPPYLIDWENFEGFSFTPKGNLETDFDVSTFYEKQNDELKNLDWDILMRFKIYIKYGNSDERISIPFWRCINYQIEHSDYLYVFAFSQWYRVNKKYSKEIKEYAKSIEESKLKFVDCDKGMNEGDYNIKLAASDKKLNLLDKQLVKSDLVRSEIEVCDVLSSDGEFIHVKFRKSSATLSHLFAQGKMSSNLIAKDKIFRKNLRAKLTSLGINKNLIPLDTKTLSTSNYTITFAIIDDKKISFIDSLPFFSLLNFRLTAEDLMLLGFNVKVKKILIV